MFDNSRQLRRIGYRVRAYARITWAALAKGVSPAGLFATRFPYVVSDRPRPSSLSVELTDACNLACDYCTNPLFAFPRTYMSAEVVAGLIEDLESSPVDRIRVCGGEPTLHPRFEAISERLAACTRFLSIVTNAQWKRTDTATALVRHYDLVEVSVDAGGAEQYERARSGASFERLVANLELLRDERRRVASRTMINVRLMLRPSTSSDKGIETRRWAGLADTVMPQYVIDQRDDPTATDVFRPVQQVDRSVPRCTLPFKDLCVKSDGTVPVCQVNGAEVDRRRRLVLGHVGRDPVADLWSGATMRAVRAAHRARDEGHIGFCRGCAGR